MGKTTGDQQQQMGYNKIVLLILATSEVFYLVTVIFFRRHNPINHIPENQRQIFIRRSSKKRPRRVFDIS